MMDTSTSRDGVSLLPVPRRLLMFFLIPAIAVQAVYAFLASYQFYEHENTIKYRGELLVGSGAWYMPVQKEGVHGLSNSENATSSGQSADNQSSGLLGSLSISENTTSSGQAASTNNQSSGQKPITTAICHRALFGRANLTHVRVWAEYNYLLGFDHIFLWYLPPIRNYEGFDELAAVPYITMKQEHGGKDNGNWRNVNEEHASQRRLILRCVRNEARGFDWVLFADADEFLWFRHNQTIQQFASSHSDMNYLSFGKREYTLSHRVESPPNYGFGLSPFPFTAGSFCRPQRGANNLKPGDEYCPANRGRSKVILKPSVFNYTDIHGSVKFPQPSKGMLHFHTDEAHFKEWVGLYKSQTTRVVPSEDFLVSQKKNEVSVHGLKASFRSNANGTFTMFYDSQLHSWLEFVANHRGLRQAR